MQHLSIIFHAYQIFDVNTIRDTNWLILWCLRFALLLAEQMTGMLLKHLEKLDLLGQEKTAKLGKMNKKPGPEGPVLK